MNRSKLLALFLLASLPLCGLLTGQGQARKDLWSLWREGFEKYEAAEKAAKRTGGEDRAVRLYEEAQKLFLQIRQDAPSWNKEVIAYRLSLCSRRINAIQKPREDALRRAAEEKQQETVRLRNDIRLLKEQLAGSRAERIDLERKASRTASAENQAARLMTENLELNKKLSASKLLLEDTREKLKHADRSGEVRIQLEKEKALTENLNRRIHTLDLEIQTLQLRIKNLTNERVESDIRTRKAEAKAETISNLLKAAEEKEKQQAGVARQLSDSRKENAELQENLQAEKKKSSRLAEQVEEYRTGKVVLPEMRKIEDELKREREKRTYSAELSAKLDQEVKTLRQQVLTLTEERKKMILELVRSTELVNRQKKMLADQAEITAKNVALEGNRKKLEEERDALKKELTNVAGQYEKLLKGVDTRIAEVQSKAEKDRKTAESARVRDAAALAEVQASMKVLNTNKNALQEKITALEKALAAEKAKPPVVVTKTETKTVTVKDDAAEKALAELQTKYAALEKNLAVEKAKPPVVVTKTETKTVTVKDDAAEKALAELQAKYVTLEKALAVEKAKPPVVVTKTVTKINTVTVKDSAAEKALATEKARSAELEKMLKNNASVETITVKDASTEKALAELRTQYAVLEKTLAAEKAKAPVVVTKTETKTVTVKDDAAEKALAELKTKYATLEKTLAAEKAKAPVVVTKTETKTVTVKDDAAEKALAELKTKYATLEKTLEAEKAKAPVVVTKTETKTVTVKDDAAEKALTELQAKYAALEKESAGKRTAELQAQSKKDGELTALKNSLRSASENAASLKKKNADLEQEIVSLKKTMAEAEKSRTGLSDREKKSSAEVTELRKKLESAKTELARTETTLVQTKKALIDAETAARREQTALASLKKENLAHSEALDKNLQLLKKELEESQAEIKKQNQAAGQLRKEVLSLNQRLSGTVPREELARKTAELSEKNAELKRIQDKAAAAAETYEAEKRLSDNTVRELRRRISESAQTTDKSTKNEINRLSATITELVEGKAQLESAMKRLTKERDAQAEELKALKLQSVTLRQELNATKEKMASMKESPEAVKKADAVLSRAEMYERMYKNGREEAERLNEKIRLLEASAGKLSKELEESRNVADRYRTELLNWGKDTSGADSVQLKRKDEAIDSLIKEGTELRKEMSMMKSELLMAKEEVRRVRGLSTKVAGNFYRIRKENAMLRSRLETAAGGKAVFAKSSDVSSEVSSAVESLTGEEKKKNALSPEAKKRYTEAVKAALAAEKKKDIPSALMNWWRAVDADPASAEAQLGLARAYLARKEKSSAAKAYAKARELGADAVPAIEKQLKAK